MSDAAGYVAVLALTAGIVFGPIAWLIVFVILAVVWIYGAPA